MTTESLSNQLIGDMDRLQQTIIDSFKKTDERLAQLGLTRHMLHPLISNARRRLPEADLTRLARLEESWRHELELAGSAAPSSKATPGVRPKRVRAQLVGRI